jgi:hypothetical protein
MTIVVGSGVQPHTAARARRAKKRRAVAAHAALRPAVKQPVVAAHPVAAAAAAIAAPSTPVPAPAPAPAPPKSDAPEGPVKSPEYAPVDLAELLGGIAGGVTGEFTGPLLKPSVIAGFDVPNHPIFGTPMGGVIPAKFAGLMIGEVNNAVTSALTNALQGVLHGKVPGVGEKQPGLGISITPANVIAGKLTKGVLTTWANMYLHGALNPPPPPPPAKDAPKDAPKDAGKDAPKASADAPPAADTPTKTTPVPLPNPQRDAMHQPLGPLARAAANNITGTVIGAVYDQTLGPLVQRLLQPGTPVKAPAPLTPGKLAKGFVGDMLTPLMVPSVALPDGTPSSFGGTLGVSIANNILGAAFDTFYSRGFGPAIENAVNGVAGVRDPEAVKKDPLPALERFLRSATRGVAAGTTTFVLGSALNSTLVHLGASIGGAGGALVAMAGAALIGSIGGSVVDATIGPLLGKLGGQVYSMITGKPSYEQRMKAAPAPAPGPAPGSPVHAPNGNPGTIPSPPPAGAPPASASAAPKAKARKKKRVAPAAGRPQPRAKLGMPRVDATAPAINVPLTQLVAAALQG